MRPTTVSGSDLCDGAVLDKTPVSMIFDVLGCTAFEFFVWHVPGWQKQHLRQAAGRMTKISSNLHTHLGKPLIAVAPTPREERGRSLHFD